MSGRPHLYRARHLAGSDWRAFLAAFADLVRVKRRHRPDPLALERFFQARDALLRDRLGVQAKDVLDGLSRTRVQAVLTRLFAGDRSIPPPLEPMLPALAETVLFWSGGGKRQVLVTHDEQSALTARLVASSRYWPMASASRRPTPPTSLARRRPGSHPWLGW